MKALVLYGSTSGNTRFLSDFVSSGLEAAGFEVVVKNARDTHRDELLVYDLLVFGSSTWDGKKVDGLSARDQNAAVQGRLQVDMRAFVESLHGFDLQQKPCAIFAVGHYSYTYTCNAAHLLEEAISSCNGKRIVETFRVSDVVDLSADAIEQWAKEIRV